MSAESPYPTHDAHEAGSRLLCPACAREICVEAEELIDGASLRCTVCGMESVLQRERIGHSGHIRWELIEAGDDDEPADAG